MNDRLDEARSLSELYDELFPICRSILGPGYRESLAILGRHVPFVVEGVASGERVFDWVVPEEWRIHSAKLTGPDGAVYADFARHNLHVVNYSAPVSGRFDLEELRPHLYSLPHLPEAIPYVTSYYERRWGFCLPHRVLEALPAGRYQAEIDSEFVTGELAFGQCVLPGESEQEVLISSYLCHPSMANNELSGPLGLVALYKRLAAWPKRRYTYRFLINPETIGSLCFLHRHGETLAAKLAAGLVLTCLGGPSADMTYKSSRQGDALVDQLARHLAEVRGGFDVRPFSPLGGSDERQYCSPGFNWPVGVLARTWPGHYPEYHSSLDDKALMGIDRVIDSVDRIEDFLKQLEVAGYFVNLSPFGEPQLGRRSLYPTLNYQSNLAPASRQHADQQAFRHRLMQVLSDADGSRPLIASAQTSGCSVGALTPVIESLEAAGLLAFLGSKAQG